MDLGLKGQVALITGGSVGIGLAVAKGLAAEGVNLVLCARNEARVVQEAQQITSEYGVKALGMSTDVTRAEEIDRLVKDAEMHSEEDRRKKGLVDAQNAADGLIYTTEKTLAEHGDKIDAASKSEVERAINDLKQAMQGQNVDEIKRLTETLTHASHALAQSMYQQSGPAGGQQPFGDQHQGHANPASGNSDDVVDAEYEEVN